MLCRADAAILGGLTITFCLAMVVAVGCTMPHPPDMFREMTGHVYKVRQVDPETGKTKSTSGAVALTAGGQLITCCHCVLPEEGADTIPRPELEVSGRWYPIVIDSTNARDDLALIHVSGAPRLKPAAISHRPPKAGDTVYGVGDPLALGLSVIRGIVSAVDRDLPFEGPGNTDLIQTDAAVNPGDSGGGLFNDRGELIGIMASGVSSNGLSCGIGFAEPLVGRPIPAF